MHLFYTPEISGKTHTLNEEESRHCIRVLRLKAGDVIFLTNGSGTLYECTIEAAQEKKCLVHVQKHYDNYEKRPYYMHIAIGPTKNSDRLEWFLEKATEIGIDEITPIICEHSERKDLKIDRLQKVLVSAMKQSLKAWLPKLNEPVRFKDFIKKNVGTAKFIAHCNEGTRESIASIYAKGDITILIGPEGDFSEKEVKMAEEQNFKSISLGNSRLRTETAGLLACATAYIKNMQ